MARWSIAVCVILVMCATVALLAFGRKGAPRRLRLLYLLLPAGQVILASFMLCFSAVHALPAWFLGFVASIGLASGPVYGLLFKSVREAEKKELASERVRLLEGQLDAQRERRAHLQAEQDEARVVRLQVSARLAEVDGFLREHEVAAARAELEQAVGLMGSGSVCHCEHPAVDALIASKAALCERLGVFLELSLDVPCDLPLSSVELCAVFSNLLDNALKACEEVPRESRFVVVRARVRGGFLTVDLNNAYANEGERPASKSRRRSNRKEHPEVDEGIAEHGWGLSIVRGIAERHGGTLLTEAAEGVFRTTVIVGVAR